MLRSKKFSALILCLALGFSVNVYGIKSNPRPVTVVQLWGTERSVYESVG